MELNYFVNFCGWLDLGTKTALVSEKIIVWVKLRILSYVTKGLKSSSP